jgi:hypothetical protein
MSVEDVKKQELLNSLSSGMFWNCDRFKLDYNLDKNIIIPRIIEYGRPNDQDIMFQIYTLKEIKKIVVTIQGLDKEKLVYFSKLLKIRPKKFVSYGKKHWSELVNNNDI